MLAFVNIKSLIYWQKGKIRDIFREKMENEMDDIHKKFIQARNAGVPVKELCKQFNICKSTAYNWIKLYSPIKRPEKETITAHKIYQLERKIQILKTENEIFKRCGCGLNSPLDEKNCCD
ncbi:MAG: helix-turn-helix domain-containing protein [Lentisphaerae bacterium]|nr:helix-turn-helix domain-containing protein [Lentisphaerota bacterium]